MPANWTADLLLLVGIAWLALGALIIIERARHDRWLRKLERLRDRLIDSSDSSLAQTTADVSPAQFEQLVLEDCRDTSKEQRRRRCSRARGGTSWSRLRAAEGRPMSGLASGCAGARLCTDRNRVLHPRRDAADRRSAARAGRAAVVRPARRSTIRRPADWRAGRRCLCEVASGCRLQRPDGRPRRRARAAVRLG